MTKRLNILCALLLLIAGCTGVPDGVEVVDGFELDRYLGTWYEIARLDHRFERGLTNVSANYSLRDDGGVAVLNRGYRADEGEWDEANGKAYFVGDADVGRLKVSFFGPFYGGYHVLALDESAPDYGYALVAGPSLKYLWVLARSPDLPRETLDQLVELARGVGYPVEELILVDHDPDGAGG